MQFPTPRILLFLHRRAPSFYPSLQHLPHQFQKKPYHFDKHLIKITHKSLFYSISIFSITLPIFISLPSTPQLPAEQWP